MASSLLDNAKSMLIYRKRRKALIFPQIKSPFLSSNQKVGSNKITHETFEKNIFLWHWLPWFWCEIPHIYLKLHIARWWCLSLYFRNFDAYWNSTPVHVTFVTIWFVTRHWLCRFQRAHNAHCCVFVWIASRLPIWINIE